MKQAKYSNLISSLFCLLLVVQKSTSFIPIISNRRQVIPHHDNYEMTSPKIPTNRRLAFPRIVLSGESAPGQSSSIQPAIDWVKNEPFENLLPKEDAHSIISELLSNVELIDDTEELVAKNWNSIEQRIRKEDRTFESILGEEVTDRLLKSIQSLGEEGGYDAEAVKAFLESPAINKLFATILYDAIFEFFQRIDVFGNIVNSLPIIGPIRKQIIAETKKTLDRSLGPLVQNFLSTYTKIAVRQASDYVLSPANTKIFASANVKLATNLLNRPVNSLLPDSSTELTDNLRKEVFDYVRNDLDMDLVDKYLDIIYEPLGDKTIESAVDVDRVLDASPTLRKRIDTLWDRALQSSSEDGNDKTNE